MYRWLLVLAFALPMFGGVDARADAAATGRAQDVATAAERRVNQLVGQRAALQRRFDEQNATQERLKNQRASWRRDRELSEARADANETASQLNAVSRDLQNAATDLLAARRVWITAIDSELAAGAGPRQAELVSRKNRLQQLAGNAPRRIVIPDTRVNQLADPEDLDQHAAALRESETQLEKQIIGLEAQSNRLDRAASLRKQHFRANEMERRDDNSSRRQQQSPTQTAAAGSPVGDASPAPNPETNGAARDMFEIDAPIVLADVVDSSTLDSLVRAQRSGDPAKRAEAARKLRDAVAARLEQLRKTRAQVEQRAKLLRK